MCETLYGQQDPMNTMFAYNKLQTNPAYAGGRDVLSTRAVYRYQWVKIAGAPQTINVNAHSPLKNERFGVGLSILNDRLGVTNQTWLMGSVAYRFPFSNDSKLSIGMSAGAYFYNIGVTDLFATDPNDPLTQTNIKGVNPNLGTGIYYYGNKYYVGLGFPNIVPLKYKYDEDISNDNNNQQVPHMFAMAGYTFEIGENKNFWIQPQFLSKYVLAQSRKAPFEADFNLTLTLYKMFNFGASYRTSIGDKYEDRESIDLMTMFDTRKGFLFAYSYDLTLSKIKQYENGSHEIMLGYDINVTKKGIRTPRYF